MSETLLDAQGVSAGYGGAPVVHDLALHVDAGEVVVLLGANGAGKTTTMLTLAGELHPSSGAVRFRGHARHEPMHRRTRGGLAFVPEQRCVAFSLTVAENLRLARGDLDRAFELFPELVPLQKRRAGLLSGGEQQLLALARALSRAPMALLADELSLGLAPLVVQRLLHAVRDAADTGVGVLLVEQHVGQVLAIADRAYVMQRGRVLFDGTAAEVRERLGEIQEAYLRG